MKTLIFLTVSLTFFTLRVSSQTDTNFHYVDFAPDRFITQPGDTVFIDLDNDGLGDYKFYLVWGSPQHYRYIASCSQDNKSSRVDTNDVRLLTDPQIQYYYNPGGYVFPNKKYLICKLERNGEFYYGWILYFGVSSTQSSDYYFTIDKYAFCKIPNYGIRVGQTSIEQSTGLTAQSISDSGIQLIADESGIAILAPKAIRRVGLYDALGRSLYRAKGNGLLIHSLPESIKFGISVLQVELEGGAVLYKKFKVE
ncbi:MAG TPA: hypothetical protein VFV37_02975 [Luteibaculaceae bacterium]|nr:hypothetical protein [Luteibaculaceae bacterium]